MKFVLIVCLFTYSLFGAELFKESNIVYDKKNKLAWQDTKDNVTQIASQDDSIKYCEELTLDGYSNWRLPSVDEYKTIIDLTRKDELMINRTFKYTLPSDYWTKDRTWRTLWRYGYYIFFKSGSVYYENRSYKKLIRCVSDAN